MREGGGSIRIASWPHWYAPNPYLELLYAALRPYGVEHVRNIPLDWKVLTDRSVNVWAAHVHWPEPFWRERGGALPGRLWGVVQLQRFLAGARRRGIRVIWTVHNLEHHEGVQLCDRLGYRLLHHAVDLRIFTSEWARRVAVDRYGRKDQSLVMPIGNYDGALPPPRSRVETLRAEGIPEHRKVLLCFGQVRRYKGFDVAAEAMKYLPDDQFHLVVAGRPMPPFAGALHSAAAAAPNVTLRLQDVDDQRLADLIAASDAVLLPYRTITGSAALLTALSFAKAVVASDLPYFREVLDVEPDARVLTAPGDAQALAGGIREFFAVAQLRRARAARAIASQLTWPHVVRPVAEWIVANAAGDHSRRCATAADGVPLRPSAGHTSGRVGP